MSDVTAVPFDSPTIDPELEENVVNTSRMLALDAVQAANSGHAGLPMGMAQVAGAWVGSHLVIRHGTKLIRPLLVIVSLAISISLLLND